METAVLVRLATVVFSISGVMLGAILGYLLLCQVVIPVCSGVISSFRRELRSEPVVALFSLLMLLFLISAIVLAIYNPTGLGALLRPLVFA
ncbi:MAG: hypothetical protein EBZ48_01690 [Proteobacteria bacterium]|nr:hypothetical protein [Pseudomonadota bacterium]